MKIKPIFIATTLLLHAGAFHAGAQVSYSSRGLSVGLPDSTSLPNHIMINNVTGLNWKHGTNGFKIDLTGDNPSVSFCNGTVTFAIPAPFSYIPVTCESVLIRQTEFVTDPIGSPLKTIRKIKIVEDNVDRDSGTAPAVPYRFSAVATEEALPEAVEVDSCGRRSVDIVAIVRLLFNSVVELDKKIELQSERMNQLRHSAVDKPTVKI